MKNEEEENKEIEKRFGESLTIDDKKNPTENEETAMITTTNTTEPTPSDENVDAEEHGTTTDDAANDDGDDEALIEIDPRQSLFDRHVSATVDENLKYMSKQFGFFLPDSEYIIAKLD